MLFVPAIAPAGVVLATDGLLRVADGSVEVSDHATYAWPPWVALALGLLMAAALAADIVAAVRASRARQSLLAAATLLHLMVFAGVPVFLIARLQTPVPLAFMFLAFLFLPALHFGHAAVERGGIHASRAVVTGAWWLFGLAVALFLASIGLIASSRDFGPVGFVVFWTAIAYAVGAYVWAAVLLLKGSAGGQDGDNKGRVLALSLYLPSALCIVLVTVGGWLGAYTLYDKPELQAFLNSVVAFGGLLGLTAVPPVAAMVATWRRPASWHK